MLRTSITQKQHKLHLKIKSCKTFSFTEVWKTFQPKKSLFPQWRRLALEYHPNWLFLLSFFLFASFIFHSRTNVSDNERKFRFETNSFNQYNAEKCAIHLYFFHTSKCVCLFAANNDENISQFLSRMLRSRMTPIIIHYVWQNKINKL